MLRLLTILFSFLLGRYKATAVAAAGVSAMPIVELIMNQGRKVALLLCSALIFSLLMVGGFFITLIEGSFAYEAEGVLYPTTLFKAGLLLLAVSLGAMVFIFARKQNWVVAPLEVAPPPKEESKPSHPIEDAIVLLIHDFVKEREARREARAEYAATAEPRAGEYAPPRPRPESTPETIYN